MDLDLGPEVVQGFMTRKKQEGGPAGHQAAHFGEAGGTAGRLPLFIPWAPVLNITRETFVEIFTPWDPRPSSCGTGGQGGRRRPWRNYGTTFPPPWRPL